MAEKILIVDDDLQTVKLVELMLTRKGFEVISAALGDEGLTVARDQHPDLIILDVMMPDMDGYEVARRLREQAETTAIPILMFTARTQLEDKVKGYEAGADGYLTKPIHPAELAAAIKAILARGKTQLEDSTTAGFCLGVISARGGLGVSSLVINLSISLSKLGKDEVIAAELQPGRGTWTSDLGMNETNGLSSLLSMPTPDITLTAVKDHLIKTKFGPLLLPASHRLDDIKLMHASGQMRKVVQNLTALSSVALLDIGATGLPDILSLLTLCNEILVVTEPFPAAARQTKLLIDQVRQKLGENRLLSVVAINRARSEMQLTAAQLEETLSAPVALFIPPAPELAYQAGLRSQPLSTLQPDHLLAQQYLRLAKELAERIG